MPPVRVDFYLLENSDLQAQLQVTFRLLQKAYQNKHQILICGASEEHALTLDEQLWTYSPESFLPHALLLDSSLPITPPIQITHAYPKDSHHDLIFNYSSITPPIYPHLKRIIELVPHDEASKTLCRDHYRTYRDQGFQLHTHPIRNSKQPY